MGAFARAETLDDLRSQDDFLFELTTEEFVALHGLNKPFANM